MEPSFDGGDDFVGVGFPDEGLGILIVLLDEAVDGRPPAEPPRRTLLFRSIH